MLAAEAKREKRESRVRQLSLFLSNKPPFDPEWPFEFGTVVKAFPNKDYVFISSPALNLNLGEGLFAHYCDRYDLSRQRCFLFDRPLFDATEPDGDDDGSDRRLGAQPPRVIEGAPVIFRHGPTRVGRHKGRPYAFWWVSGYEDVIRDYLSLPVYRSVVRFGGAKSRTRRKLYSHSNPQTPAKINHDQPTRDPSRLIPSCGDQYSDKEVWQERYDSIDGWVRVQDRIEMPR